MSDIPDIRYARSGDLDIAYRVLGDGPFDLVTVTGFVSHLDMMWEIPSMAARARTMSSAARVIQFDKRGTGLSDRTLGFGSVADRMDDIRAVMDAAGVERAVLQGISEGGPLALVFAATYPDRVSKLLLFGTFARFLWAPDYPQGVDPEQVRRSVAETRRLWGTGHALRAFVPNAPDEALPLLARYERASCTPHMVEEILLRNTEMDVRDVLSAITVPTLVIHVVGDPIVPVAFGRYLAEHIPAAQFLEIEGRTHGSWDVSPQMAPEVREFLLLGDENEPDLDRMLATVLFTDIVQSTEHAASMGDQAWRDTLDHHDRIARNEVSRFRGELVNTTGDGLLATFDGPARAIGCAQAIGKSIRPLGIGIRAGLHTGEIELRGNDITGMGVVIARRICDSAGTGELLASRTVKDLVTGSGITFEPRGAHELKGVPDNWDLYAVS